MHTEQLANGKVKFIEYYKDPYTNKRLKKSVTMDKRTPQSENKARKYLNEKIAIALSETRITNITFHELYQKLLTRWKPTVSENTILTYRKTDERLLSLISKDVLANKIDRRFLQNVVDELNSHNYAQQTLNLHYIRLKKVFGLGRRLGYITNDEIDFVEFTRSIREKDNEIKYLEKHEVEQFIKYYESKNNFRMVAITKILYLTGMRIGELIALREQDIDTENNIIDINASYSSKLKKRGKTKNKQSVRKIKVGDNVIELIKQMVIYNHNRLSEEILENNKEKYIFLSRNGTPVQYTTLNNSYKDVAGYLDIPVDVSCHTFRHSHISLLVELNTPIKQIMERVGHKDSKTTIQIYTHVTDKMKDELANKLDNFVI